MILTTTPSGTPWKASIPLSSGTVLATTGLNVTIVGSSSTSLISNPDASTSGSPLPAGGRYSKEMVFKFCFFEEEDLNAKRNAFRPDGFAMFSGLVEAACSGGTRVISLKSSASVHISIDGTGANTGAGVGAEAGVSSDGVGPRE